MSLVRCGGCGSAFSFENIRGNVFCSLGYRSGDGIPVGEATGGVKNAVLIREGWS